MIQFHSTVYSPEKKLPKGKAKSKDPNPSVQLSDWFGSFETNCTLISGVSESSNENMNGWRFLVAIKNVQVYGANNVLY